MERRNKTRLLTIGYFVALIVAIAGAASAVNGPLAGTNQVGSADIIDDEVTSADIRDGGVGSVDLRDGAVTGAKVAPDAINGSHVRDNSLTNADIDQATLGLAKGRTIFDSDSTNAGATSVTQVPGRFSVAYTCPETLDTDGTLEFTNLSGADMNLFVDTGGEDPEYVDLGDDTRDTRDTTFAGDRFVYSFHVPTSRGDVFGTVNVNTVDRSTQCHHEVQAFLSS